MCSLRGSRLYRTGSHMEANPKYRPDQILHGTRKVVLKPLRGRNNSSIILFRYTSLPSLPFPPSFFHPSPFSPVEIPFKCLEGEQMSKTTFQIPMCVLVPVFEVPAWMCACDRARKTRAREEARKSDQVTNICEKMSKGFPILCCSIRHPRSQRERGGEKKN